MLEIILIMLYLLLTLGCTYIAVWASDVMIILIPTILNLGFWDAMVTPFFTVWILQVYPFWGFFIVYIVVGVSILWKSITLSSVKKN